MPIRRYVERDGVFEPQTISVMNTALAETAQILGIERDEKKREKVAKFIIRLATEDGTLDAAALRNRAVAALGGVEYCNILPKPQTSPISRIVP
jgi:hypothetical protein